MKTCYEHVTGEFTVLNCNAKCQLISKWFLGVHRFPPKKEQRQVDLRYHSSKVEFVRLFFEGNRQPKKHFEIT